MLDVRPNLSALGFSEMRFVRTDIGLVNLAHVTRVQEDGEGKALLLVDGEWATSRAPFDQVEPMLDPLLPNTTDAQGLFLEMVDGEVQNYVVPIVAWRITTVGALPMVPAGDECSYIIYADGRVDEPHFGSYDSLEAAIEDFRARNPEHG